MGEAGRVSDKVADKVALITGTSSGFGLLSALELASRGYMVIATMRDVAHGGELLRRARESQVERRLRCIALDVTNESQISETIGAVLAEYGRIDVLVNNAGYAVGGFVEEVPLAEWRRQLETNFFGLVAVTQAALPAMRARRSGLIINVSSISGRSGFPGYGPYAASKFAVEGFSESLRHEMSSWGVKVVLVEPGSFKTPIWNKGLQNMHTRPGSPYKEQLDAVLTYSRRSADTAPDPIGVARLIGRITAMRSPRLRYAIGQGSRLLLWGKALLPWKWMEWAIAAGLKQSPGSRRG
ncbi:SDR family oxidoreductase [Paenibacillus sp. SYP-B4298]|uniref:SDR family oxidoreductase n=1 Tax=Paenibacillus sp. SYP-B4298 TaxID=2996034 RepID=UPI0022DDB9DE|nr:SDR family oxidoreductase [Paenibacillus sp. SYP-B4298]